LHGAAGIIVIGRNANAKHFDRLSCPAATEIPNMGRKVDASEHIPECDPFDIAVVD
jgi:hypothetical protein